MLYEMASRVIVGTLRVPGLRSALTWFSKVWLRHARLAAHLRTAAYDGVVDGGANIGEFAALVRSVCPSTPLICVEPHPPSADVLRRRGFSVVQAALWSEARQLTLSQPAAASTSCTVTSEAPAAAPHWDVAAVRLDSLPLTGRDLLIKLDLQGAEPQALEGMGDLWHRTRGLLLEVSYGEHGTYERLREALAARGFQEVATFNELDAPGGPAEADKLWLRR